MKILGIETSCDETAAAVVEDGITIRSSVVASQLAHAKYGGVVPELASREHLRAIVPVVRLALEQADTKLDELAAIAVTEGPGLVGSLLVGITYAKALCFARNVALIGLNHIEGHIHAVVLEAGKPLPHGHGSERPGVEEASAAAHGSTEADAAGHGSIEAGAAAHGSTEAGAAAHGSTEAGAAAHGSTEAGAAAHGSTEAGATVEYPALALVVSGGHTHLFEVREGFAYRLLGKTRDDAAGEAYDKVAKLLGFGYPGGPIIDQLAPHGNPRGVKFTLARMKGNTLDFSFSGLKTAVLRWVESHDLSAEIEARRRSQFTSAQDFLSLTPQPTLDLLASFQYTVIEELLRRAAVCIEEIGARSLIVSGGVASNAGLRAAARAAGLVCPVFFPTPALSTDNAAMIAAAAFRKLRSGQFSDFTLRASANLALA